MGRIIEQLQRKQAELVLEQREVLGQVARDAGENGAAALERGNVETALRAADTASQALAARPKLRARGTRT